MKAWKKTSPELVAAFDKALPASPAVTRRPMFGYASAFVNGNMFAGTFQDTIVVRLTETDRAVLLKQKGAEPFEPMGHPMKEYVVVPASIVAKPKELSTWIERGHRYASTLPAKGGTKKKTAAKKTAAVAANTPEIRPGLATVQATNSAGRVRRCGLRARVLGSVAGSWRAGGNRSGPAFSLREASISNRSDS